MPKISALTADTAPTSDDLVPIVNDPAGTPATRKTTVAQLAASSPFAEATAFRGQLLSSGEEVFPRHCAAFTTVATGSGNLRLSFFTARTTESITKVRLTSGSTAAGATPTLVRVGVYSVAGNGDITLEAAIANDTTLLAAATTEYERSLTATFNKVAGSRYAVGVLVVTAATAPTLQGTSAGGPSIAARAPRLTAFVSGQTDLPASVASASLGATSLCPYFEVAP